MHFFFKKKSRGIWFYCEWDPSGGFTFPVRYEAFGTTKHYVYEHEHTAPRDIYSVHLFTLRNRLVRVTLVLN